MRRSETKKMGARAYQEKGKNGRWSFHKKNKAEGGVFLKRIKRKNKIRPPTLKPQRKRIKRSGR